MDHIVVVNPTFIPKLEAAGIPTKDVTYIPNFVTKDEFYPLENTDKQIFRQDQGYKTDDFIILGVGQVQERKGIFDFIQLARDNPQWQFIWAGGFSFGGITAGYEELKKVLSNPPANLKFPGIVDRDQMNNYYNLANVFLLPSFNELFAMSALEAFSAGTPTILRDLDLYKEILAGYYLAAPDRDAMQKKLEQLQSDPKLQQEMINQALEASKRYSKDYVAGLWEKFYQEQAERK